MLKKVKQYILGMNDEEKAVILLDEFAFKAPSRKVKSESMLDNMLNQP